MYDKRDVSLHYRAHNAVLNHIKILVTYRFRVVITDPDLSPKAFTDVTKMIHNVTII